MILLKYYGLHKLYTLKEVYRLLIFRMYKTHLNLDLISNGLLGVGVGGVGVPA